MNININDCLSAIAQGDKNALRELYGLTKNRLIGISFYITKNISDAEDIMQETFFIIAKKAYSFRGRNGSVWIEKICRNLSLDLLRKRKRNISFSDAAIENMADPNDLFDFVTDKNEIRNALTFLTKKEYDVIMLLYFSDYSFKLAADMLKIKQDTIYKIHNRALKKLKSVLNGD